jgi:PAS domain S-box-containing protein
MRLKKQVFSDLQEEIRSLKSELEGLKKVHSGSGLNPGFVTDNEQHYRELFENAPMPYQSLDENGFIITVNNPWLEMLGYSKEELTGTFIGNYLTESSLVKLKERFPLFKQRGWVKDADFEMITRSGSIVSVLINGRIQKNEQGNFKATHCILTNITERQKTEDALQVSEMKFKHIVQASPMGMHMYELQKNGKLVFTGANPAANRILGTNHDQFIGKSIEEAFPGLIQTEVPDRYRDIARNGSTWHTEQIEYNEGAIRGAFEVVAFQTQPGNMVTLFNDITQRKKTEAALLESEERLSFALTATNDGIWDYKPLENKLFWSPRYYSMLGYEPEEFPASYENWRQLVHPDDLSNIERALTDCMEGKSDYYIEEGRLKNKHGGYQWMLIRGKVIERDVSGKVLRMSGTHVDITERKIIYNELLKAKERAEESDRLKSAFLANLSHEIRTPMNAILGFTDLLINPELSFKQKNNYIEIIHKSGNHLLSIISDIIEISQIDTGQITVHPAPVNIDQLIANLYEQLRVTIPANKPVELKIDPVSGDNGSLIITDEVKLQQILTNLVANAIKFTDTGMISMGFHYISKDEIEFTVQDTGIGIDEKYHKMIFERFCQVDGDQAIKQGGSGLGLAISKAYVNMLGGKIWVQSELNKGSRFSFTIPAVKPVPDEKPAKTTARAVKREKVDCLGQILIAEDDEYNYLFLKKVLSDTGYHLLRAHNGKEAIDICASNNDICMVLMDIKMPVMNGLDAARHIKKLKPLLPLLAQTAYALEMDRKQIEQAGFSGHIIKPIEIEKLLDMIESLLQR